MPVCCPVSWCTRRFSNKTELRGHQLWHTKRSRCCADQERLAQGSILCARGPPDNRYYRVFWRDASPQWLRHTQFTAATLPMVELFFQVNSHLDRNTDIEVPWENRCAQCNEFFDSPALLQSHIQQQHTCPVRPGTRSYYKATMEVRRRHQESLARVTLLGGKQVTNRFKSKCLGMTLTADGDDSEHVRLCIINAEVCFGKYRQMLQDRKLPKSFKVSTYKGDVLVKETFSSEIIYMTSRTCRRRPFQY